MSLRRYIMKTFSMCILYSFCIVYTVIVFSTFTNMSLLVLWAEENLKMSFCWERCEGRSWSCWGSLGRWHSCCFFWQRLCCPVAFLWSQYDKNLLCQNHVDKAQSVVEGKSSQTLPQKDDKAFNVSRPTDYAGRRGRTSALSPLHTWSSQSLTIDICNVKMRTVINSQSLEDTQVG